jgi:hypothetical protein
MILYKKDWIENKINDSRLIFKMAGRGEWLPDTGQTHILPELKTNPTPTM